MVLSCNNLFTNSKTYFVLMKTRATVGYLAPEIEVNFVVVEQGIAASNMEQLGTVYDEQEW